MRMLWTMRTTNKLWSKMTSPNFHRISNQISKTRNKSRSKLINNNKLNKRFTYPKLLILYPLTVCLWKHGDKRILAKKWVCHQSDKFGNNWLLNRNRSMRKNSRRKSRSMNNIRHWCCLLTQIIIKRTNHPRKTIFFLYTESKQSWKWTIPIQHQPKIYRPWQRQHNISDYTCYNK